MSDSNKANASPVQSSEQQLKGNVTVTVTKPPAQTKKTVAKTSQELLNEARLTLYVTQENWLRNLLRDKPSKPFVIETLRDNFVETKRFALAESKNLRGLAEMDELYAGFDHLYMVDDMLGDILATMPAQMPAGWEVTSRVRNYLNVATVGVLPAQVPATANHASICAYVLNHFGVASYTNDRAYFIGHIVGYLFICYYFSYLKIQYGVLPMQKNTVKGYDYQVVSIADQVSFIQALDYDTKKTVYRLAVFCAKISLYAIDKVIEKMLIAEVNDFDKNIEIKLLEDMLKYGG